MTASVCNNVRHGVVGQASRDTEGYFCWPTKKNRANHPNMQNWTFGQVKKAKGGLQKGGYSNFICLPVQCLSALPDRQLYTENATALSLWKDDQIACKCRCVAAAWCCHPSCHANHLKCRYPLFACPLSKPALKESSSPTIKQEYILFVGAITFLG